MVLPTIQLTITKVALAFIAAFLVMSVCFLVGMVQGRNAINVRWQSEKLSHAEMLATLRGKIEAQESGHRLETARIAEQLRKTEDQYEKATAAYVSERAERLRLSQERAGVYAALAEAGPAQCRDLAGHATKLDGSLEEGRGLVGELQTALRRREDQLRLLGSQIINDRNLLGER